MPPAAKPKANPVAKAKAAAKAVKKGGVEKKKTRKIRTSVHFNRPKTLIKKRNPMYQVHFMGDTMAVMDVI